MAAVLVHIDLEAGRPDSSSLVALAAGRAIASSWGAAVYAAAIVRAPDDITLDGDTLDGAPSSSALPGLDLAEAVLARAGADKLWVATTRTPLAPMWAAIGAAWQRILDQLRPRLVLFGADAPSAPELAPRTAARIGARLLYRARAMAADVVHDGADVALRDADGGVARAHDGGAAVALIGHAEPAASCRDRLEAVILAPVDGDPRVEVVAAMPAEPAQNPGVVIALGDDAIKDAELVAAARRLAKVVGGQLVGTLAAVKAGAIERGAVVDRDTPLAPELCIAIGDAQLDLAGASRLVKIGSVSARAVDGALTGDARDARERLAELVAKLEAIR